MTINTNNIHTFFSCFQFEKLHVCVPYKFDVTLLQVLLGTVDDVVAVPLAVDPRHGPDHVPDGGDLGLPVLAPEVGQEGHQVGLDPAPRHGAVVRDHGPGVDQFMMGQGGGDQVPCRRARHVLVPGP